MTDDNDYTDNGKPEELEVIPAQTCADGGIEAKLELLLQQNIQMGNSLRMMIQQNQMLLAHIMVLQECTVICSTDPNDHLLQRTRAAGMVEARETYLQAMGFQQAKPTQGN